MEAVILAGGFGTRLHDLTKDTPKPMVLVAGKPFLTYILDELDYYHFDHVVMAVSYLKEQIISYFGNKYKNITIDYAIENEPLGTGGAIVNCFPLLKEEWFFVINGDTISIVDYHEMSKIKNNQILVKKMTNFDRYGEVKIDEKHCITDFNEKKFVKEGYINTVIYYLNKTFMQDYKLEGKFSVENDVFAKYIDTLKIKAFATDGYFIDIGVPEDYERAQEELKRTPALFLDRDGIINIDKGHVHKIEDFEFTPFIFDLTKGYQDKGFKIVVITNQAGIAKGMYPVKDYEVLNEYMIQEFQKRGITIAGTFYCPHRDEDHCDCRKPKPGLFIKAIHDLQIDVENSVAIGDKIGDLVAAHAAGVKNLYFVKTRYEEYDPGFEYHVLNF